MINTEFKKKKPLIKGEFLKRNLINRGIKTKNDLCLIVDVLFCFILIKPMINSGLKKKENCD